MGAFQVAGADTSFIDVSVLQPDTTPARLTRAVVVDSVTVLLEFDDNLEPESRSDLFGVTLTADETGAPIRVDVFHERDYVRWRDQLQDSFARVDSLEAARRAEDALEDIPLSGDTLARDSAAAPAPAPAPPAARSRPVPPALPRATGGGRPQGDARAASGEALTPDGRPLPSRRLVLRLADFLVVNAGYKVVADNVVNINGIPRGGGESAVVREPPPAPDSTAAPDTATAPDSPTDSAAVAPASSDSTQVRDTIPPARDTIPGGGQPFLPGRRR